MHDDDLFGAASWALIRSGVDLCAPVDPREVARGLGLKIVTTDARGECGVLVGNDPPTILLRRRRDERAMLAALAHEIGHHAARMTGALEQHSEDDASEIATRILVPRGFVRVECLTRGRTIEELPALCPLVDARTVLARARHALGLHVPVFDISDDARSNSSAA